MILEKKLNTNISRRNALGIIGIDLTSLLLFGCERDVTGPIEVSGDLNIIHDTKQTGMIQGRVTIPGIEDNKIVYNVGIQGADIEAVGTDFKTTSIVEGLYAIDGIPTGSCNIKASKKSYRSDTKPVIVTRGDVINVPDLNLTPNSRIFGKDNILYGKIYDEDRETPFARKKVNLHRVGHIKRDSEVEYVPADLEGTTITSSDGSYAFYTGSTWYILVSEGVKIKFMNPIDSIFMGDLDKHFGLIQKDAFVSEYL